MREILDDIQHSISKGVSRKAIYEKLKENGFKITYESFLVTLKRLRKEKREAGKSSTASGSAHTPAPATSGVNAQSNQFNQPEEEIQFDSSTRTRLAAKASSYAPEDESNPLLDKLTN